MATVNKAFKVKNGLVVDGTATDVVVGSDTLPEVIQDTVGGMVTGNTESGISVTYDDGTGKLNFSVTDTNTTYSVSAETVTGGANLRLTGSDASTDDVKIAGSGATTVTRTDANTITVSSTDNNTTYDLATSGTSTATISLTGSDSTADSFTITGSGATTVSHSAGAITISSTDTNTVTNAFSTIATTSGTSPVASSTSDTLTLSAGTGISVTGNSSTDTVTFANTGVTSISGTTNEIEVSAGTGSVTIGLPDNVTIGGALTVTGDLTVNGTTTTLNTENLAVEDNLIVLNSNVTGTPSLNAGIEVERGTSANSSIYWNESVDKWYVNDGSTAKEIALVGDATFNTFSTFTDGSNSATPDSSSDTFTFAAGTGLTATVNASTDTVTYSLDASATATVGAVALPNSKIEDGTVTSAGTSVTMDTFALATYKSAKYVVQMTNASGDAHLVEVLVTAVTTNAYVVEYGELITNTSLGDVTADSDGTTVTVSVGSTASGVVVKHTATYIEA